MFVLLCISQKHSMCSGTGTREKVHDNVSIIRTAKFDHTLNDFLVFGIFKNFIPH